MPRGVGLGQNVGLRDFCHILTSLPPGASVFHKHMSSLKIFSDYFIDRDDDDESEDVGYGTYDNMEEEEEEAEPMETTPREVNTMALLLLV